ncbi:hypothetical protein BO221_37090 [Archangium sp. Cb G35]|uniref:hypothetical protein n=1 Tax=Archangium sp. Cb G35 TaxID=1920190 RepID=UPI0009363D9A|nr:hypothetical protein [Archangium sp. Cb G35]OJT19121.1 hypothetical protein BO221_37090 [Archangium sp. Cb G35]
MPKPREGSASFWRDARAAFALVFRTPIAGFVLYGLAFTVSFAAMHGANLQAVASLNSRKVYLWRVLSALPPTAWMLICIFLLSDWERTRSAWPSTRKGWMVITFSVLLGMPFIVLPLMAQYFVWMEDPRVHAAMLTAIPIAHSSTKSVLINLIGLASGVLLASVILGLHFQLIDRLPELQCRAEQPGSEGLEEDVRWYYRCREQLGIFLTLCCVIMGSSILGLSSLRHLINEILPPTAVVPTSPILGYGIYYTGLLASAYLPAHRALMNVGKTLAERLARQSLSDSVTWKQRNEEREAARTWLGLQRSPLQDFQQGLSILTPLLASLSSLLLGPGG